MLHGRQRSPAGIRRADRYVHGHLLVGRPFRVDVGEARQLFEDFRAWGAGIGRSHRYTRLPGAARHRLITG